MLACSSIVRFLLISASISAARTERASCVGPRNVLEAEADVLAHLEAQLASLLPQIEMARAAVRDMQLEVNKCESIHGLAASAANAPKRRKETGEAADAAIFQRSCWSANSSITKKSCTCLPNDSPGHRKALSTRPTIRVLSPSSGAWTGGGIDAFLLKIVIEEIIGATADPTAPVPSPPRFVFCGWLWWCEHELRMPRRVSR
jgi:hypothetical protein